MAKEGYVVSRAIEGVTINGKEYLIDENDKIMTFETEADAKAFMDDSGVTEDAYDIDIEEDAAVQ